ncbi:MAG TPA: hypothetical protein VFU32_07750, partial [Ktedonobacterales bacterium]|nr:hypothetical protein [Ktedonobacterales bacterium]
MDDNPYLLETLAEDFWSRAGCGPEGAADLETAATWALPVEIASLAHLRLHDVATRMKRLGVETTL